MVPKQQINNDIFTKILHYNNKKIEKKLKSLM